MKKYKYAAGIILCILLMQNCINFQEIRYKSKAIDKNIKSVFPSEYNIGGLTWIAADKSYCIPTCLQMIGEWNGIHEPIEYYNWLSGFSYGATYKDSFASFMPVSDAMSGIMFASGFLGLERNLKATADEQAYINAVKSELAADHPVMILYDYNVLTEDTFFFPHAAVLTGYSEDCFYYYEPGFQNRFTPDAGKGSKAPIKLFMEGIMNLHKKMGLGEGYHFMTFSSIEKRTDFNAVWKRNSEQTRGTSISMINLHTGIRSFRALAEEIRKSELPDWAWQELLPVWFSYGSYSRKDNAEFISKRFSDSQACSNLTDCLSRSSGKFSEINNILSSPDYSVHDYQLLIPGLLAEIYLIEKELSGLLLKMQT